MGACLHGEQPLPCEEVGGAGVGVEEPDEEHREHDHQERRQRPPRLHRHTQRARKPAPSGAPGPHRPGCMEGAHQQRLSCCLSECEQPPEVWRCLQAQQDVAHAEAGVGAAAQPAEGSVQVVHVRQEVRHDRRAAAVDCKLGQGGRRADVVPPPAVIAALPVGNIPLLRVCRPGHRCDQGSRQWQSKYMPAWSGVTHRTVKRWRRAPAQMAPRRSPCEQQMTLCMGTSLGR